MKKTLITLALALIAVLCVASPASATIITLSDQNSVANIDTSSQAGVYNWLVDGTDYMFQQWFWYRIGSGTAQSIDTISNSPTINQLDSGIVQLTYQNAEVQVDITYALLGGSVGSGIADIAETIRIRNASAGSYDFHFFQYSDFDLGPAYTQDRVAMLNDNTVRQWNAAAGISETVATPAPNAHELNYYANTLISLNTAPGYNLNGSSAAGPGDVTWAFQWDKTMAAGGSFIISKDKQINATPEPGSMLLMGGALLFLSKLASRLRKS